MAAYLTAEERDALFQHILLTFGAFEDFERAIGAGDLAEAHKVGRRISDGLLLILDGGLGFAQQTAEPLTLNLPVDQLQSIMARMGSELAARYECMEPEWAAAERLSAEVATARDACVSVLEQI